jgi:ABC-type lipoprotein export system ATPase subunit
VHELLLQLNAESGSTLIVATHNDRLAPAMEQTLRLTGAIETGRGCEAPRRLGVG